MDQQIIRGSLFLITFLTLSVLQIFFPGRKPIKKRHTYILSNLLLLILNNIILSFIPIIPYQMALYTEKNRLGLLHILDLPVFIEILIGILFMDFIIYLQHRAFHTFDLLWSLHAVHHIDPMLDLSTGLRFHPFEIIISNFIKVAGLLIIGLAPIGIVIFEVLLNLLSMFNHSNLKLPKKLDDKIGKLIFTPRLHIIHHSKILSETHSNYGFSIVLWDKLFGTFTLNGRYPQEKINIGIVPMPKVKYQTLPGMLLYPFNYLFKILFL